MENTGKFKRVSPAELDGVLKQARAENWSELVLVGPAVEIGDSVQNWPHSLKSVKRVFQLSAYIERLANKLESITTLTSLDLRGNIIGDDGAKVIAASLSGLNSLNLRGNSIGDVGAQVIAVSLTGLTSLDLRRNRIGDDGAKAISASLTGLTSLDLGRNRLGDDGAKFIAASLAKLISLDLGSNSIGAEGAGAIAASLTGLTSLDLGRNSLGDDGTKFIAASLSKLISLDLGSNSIGTEGARAIATSLTGLTSLDLGRNRLGDDGAKFIATSLTKLTSLDLGHNYIGAEGARAIAASMINLTSLDLSFNSVRKSGTRAIAESLRSLTSLDLRYNKIGASGAKAIAALLTSLTSLNLGNNNIGEDGVRAVAASLTSLRSLSIEDSDIEDGGAEAIAASLTGLTSLNLNANRIGADGAKAIAASLLDLTSLDMWFNYIGDDGARAIATSLTGLTSLNLHRNGIGAGGAKAIAASLTSLTSLNLGRNSIGDDGAMAIAASLTGLNELDLGFSNIGDDGARAIAASLTNLTSLSLPSNDVGDDGAKALLEAWSGVSRTNQLRHLSLSGNSKLGGLLPKEILETDDGQAILAAYRSFSSAQERQNLQSLNELKLLVVGNEAVGKTSLLRYVIEGKSRDPNEIKTPGVVQHERIETQGWSPENCQVRLNVWDFGGQEMMRGTHRFFLTERSLYLLVLEDRRQDDRSIHDWMKTIRNRGMDSPVIVVINKSDEGKQDLRLDEKGLPETYPNIVAFLRTSCDPGNWAVDSIEKLRRKVVETTKDERLKHVRDAIPANWLRIKNQVRALADQRSVLPHADFIALCREPGDSIDTIIDEDEQRALLRLLHDLGTIVAHGLQRDAPATRREVSLLDPNWLTGAVYRILDKASSVDQEGEFSRHQLTEWLDPGPYPPERHEFILDMMQDPDIGLCFRLPIPREERYLAPEALPATRRFYGKWPEHSLRFSFTYNYLPPGLIPRFIVESHQNLTPEKSRWRTGVVLKVRDCQVLVLADLDQRRVDLEVDGPAALRRAALNVVLNDLEAVHAQNPESEPVARVPLPDRPQKDVGYKHLLKLEQLYGPNHEFLPEGAERPYQVRELLDGVRLDQTVSALTRKPDKIDDPLDDVKTPVVILIHGIRTAALWQNSIRRVLEEQGFKVQLTNYGYFDLLRFLFPWQPFSGAVVREITQQVRHTLRMNKGSNCSIIAHSFGTFVVARMLRDHTDLEFDRIIFCGSVVRHKFRFEEYTNRFKEPLINEVGTIDFWPATAEAITFGYGSAGTYGFRRPAVRDRWHNGRSHSAFLDRDFCQKYWLPFLRNGEIIEDDEAAERPPWWLWVVSTLKIKYLLAAALVLFLWYLLAPLLPVSISIPLVE